MRLLVTDAAAQPPRQATAWLIMTLGRSKMHRTITALALTVLISGCSQRPKHNRLYKPTDYQESHAIYAEQAFSHFGHPELLIIFNYFSLVVRDKALSVKPDIVLSPDFWYQNNDPEQGSIYTKLVIDMGNFNGMNEWSPFLDKIESRFLREWIKVESDIEKKYGLKAELLYIQSASAGFSTGSFTLTIRKPKY